MPALADVPSAGGFAVLVGWGDGVTIGLALRQWLGSRYGHRRNRPADPHDRRHRADEHSGFNRERLEHVVGIVLVDSLWTFARDVNGQSGYVLRRFHDAFGKCGMCVNHLGYVGNLGSDLHAKRNFMDDVGRMGTDDVRAQDSLGLRIRNNFE